MTSWRILHDIRGAMAANGLAERRCASRLYLLISAIITSHDDKYCADEGDTYLFNVASWRVARPHIITNSL